MSAPRGWVLATAVALSACSRPPAVNAGGDASPAASTTLAAVAPSGSATPHPASSEAKPEPIVPASPEARATALNALLEGTAHAGELPEAATDPGARFDPGLRRRLTTLEVEVPSDPLLVPQRGDVQLGAPSATVPIPHVERVLAGLRPRLRACYWTALEGAPPMTGRLAIRANVSAEGAVTSTEAVVDSGLPVQLVGCAKAAIARAKFEAPGAKGSTLTIPMSFTR